MTPVRVQRKRTKGWRMPDGAAYVGRPSRWGNPFRLGDTYLFGDASALKPDGPLVAWPMPTWREPGHYDNGIHVVRLHDVYVGLNWFRAYAGQQSFERHLALLRGRDLACWCPLNQPCHADVLLELANR